MKIIFTILITLLTLISCSLSPEKEEAFYQTFEVTNGFDIFFDSGAMGNIKEHHTPSSIVLNGSYFGITETGSYFPAGLWRNGKDEISPAIFDDPNITHVVSISRSDRKVVDIFPNSGLLTRRWGSDHDVFQAGPLVLSGGILQDFGDSWHARSKHERTLLGKTESGRVFFFVFTEKVSLHEGGATVAKKFQNDPITLLNLDGGPSTAYFDGEKGFRENQKLPIVLHIRP